MDGEGVGAVPGAKSDMKVPALLQMMLRSISMHERQTAGSTQLLLAATQMSVVRISSLTCLET